MSALYSDVDLWILWIVTWLCAARWSAKTTARPTAAAEAAYGLCNLLGLALIVASPAYASPAHAGTRLTAPLWHTSPPVQWVLVLFTCLGFAICWWARLYLGSLWSGSVARKANHRVVQTGPYRFVRHPIYTGLLLASAATVALAGSPLGLLGLALLYPSLHYKARLEERFLRLQLGPADYDTYAARTPMLIPGSPPRPAK